MYHEFRARLGPSEPHRREQADTCGTTVHGRELYPSASFSAPVAPAGSIRSLPTLREGPEMKRSALFLIAVAAVLSLPATAAAFRGVAVHRLVRHSVVIASQGGLVRTVRAPGRAGPSVSAGGSSCPRGAFRRHLPGRFAAGGRVYAPRAHPRRRRPQPAEAAPADPVGRRLVFAVRTGHVPSSRRGKRSGPRRPPLGFESSSPLARSPGGRRSKTLATTARSSSRASS